MKGEYEKKDKKNSWKVICWFLALVLCGCAATENKFIKYKEIQRSAFEYVDTAAVREQAKKNYPKAFEGEVYFKVESIGFDDGVMFLNSEDDYRSKNNLSVVISPELKKQVYKRFGKEPRKTILKKTIKAKGPVSLFKVHYYSRGGLMFYYQLRMYIHSMDDFEVLEVVYW
ncbi:hypothetical protein [Marinibactrum halimedae]|uniref:Uncharacterized protein n=1 Tax=Marinibactrum halimedae TaxID=1444977 RepID=A0AA37WMF3_9GAMM|nr:hypothetical protein [Marinibactrum halimedae]MCD9457661.1 hypothetical protein [Marinibactrum halimedae]GLS24966.1 hypothetical protein GCM10007877_06800 [Marinibactrum halimedae]